MEQKTTQKIVLDSCVVIDMMEQNKSAHKIKKGLKGKPVCLVLCDVVLKEVSRVRNWNIHQIISRIRKLTRGRVEMISVNDEQRDTARSISDQYSICHRGDNFILALCKIMCLPLITRDRMLLKACEFAGVAAFRPNDTGGI